MKMIVVCGIFFIWLVVFPNTLDAQQAEDRPVYRNELFGEILGSGIPYSLNYSRLLLQKDKMQFWIKTGGGYFGQFKRVLNIDDDSMISANMEAKVIIGSGRNRFEAGLGYLFVYWFDITKCDPERWDCHEYSHIIFSRIGYRHYTKNRRWVFSIGWTPAFENYIDFRGDVPTGKVVSFNTKSIQLLYGGIGIGWQF